MGRMTGIKWEKSIQYRPVHNIISSDFPKYNPQPWKFMEGPPRVEWLLSYEYQRMWLEERDLWKKRMYPENTTVNVDVVKRYVLTFKFEGVSSKTTTIRAPNDKAICSKNKEVKIEAT